MKNLSKNSQKLFLSLIVVLSITQGIYSQHLTIDQLIKNSNVFQNTSPLQTTNNLIASIIVRDQSKSSVIEEHANKVHPIIHKNVPTLIEDFLHYKQEHGTEVERKLYATMTFEAFIDRLLIKRPLMFMDSFDSYKLRDGSRGYGDFINDGRRDNKGQLGSLDSFEEKGIYVGLVGARFEKAGLMEWAHMIVTPEQNTKKNGYGFHNESNSTVLGIWSKFYDEKFPTFKEAQADTSGRFIQIKLNLYLDSLVYKKRMHMVIEPFLVNANYQGEQYQKKVYCHAVGLGLGVWQISPIQARLLLEVFNDILNNHDFKWISDIDFSWFPQEYDSMVKIKHLETFKNHYKNEIKIHYSKRKHADR